MKHLQRLLHRSPSGLRTQLLLGTAVPVISLLVILAIVGMFGFTRLTQTLVEQRDAELVQLAAGQIANYWADSVLLLTQIASTEVARQGDVMALQDLLESSAALLQRFDVLCVTDSLGIVIASKGGEAGVEMDDHPFFQRARRLQRPVRSDLYVDDHGRHQIAIAVPSYDASGQFAGCVIGIWRLGESCLGLAVGTVRVGGRGFAYLVDEHGTILAHPDPTLLGADASRHPAVAALLRGERGAQTLRVEGDIRVVGYAPISLHALPSSLFADESWEDWGLLTSELWKDLIAPLRPYVRLMIVVVIALVSLPLIVLAVGTQRIAAPLQSLVPQVERVAAGHFDTQVSRSAGSSEMRELGLAFNKMVDQLRRYQSDIQNYVVSILTSQEEERKRIARELHDETAQALVVLGRRIEALQETATTDELLAELEALRDIVDDTLQGVRRFTRDLRPPLLEELGLPRSLEILGDRLDREESFSIDVRIIGEQRPLLPELELGLYRLAQESLSNVRRHAQAKHVEVTLTYGRDQVSLQISDDGVGFDAPTDPNELMRSGRLGLMGIHERARLFGGRATIRSARGRGTVVSVVVPLSSIVLPSEASRRNAG